MQNHRALDTRLVIRRCKFFNELGRFLSVSDLNARQDFQALAVGVIHQENRGFVVSAQVSDADVLQVSAKIRESERSGAQHSQESWLAAAVLNIRLTVFADGRHVKAVARADEFDFRVGQGDDVRGASLKSRVVAPRTIMLLRRFNTRRKGQLKKFVRHLSLLPWLFGLKSCAARSGAR